MASLPRYLIIYNDCYFHLTWQCHNKSFYFKTNYFKKYYYDLLLKYKDRYQIEIYSYCLMSSHVHLAGHCDKKENLSNFIRIVNSLFARHYNKKTGKRGQVCMDRFKSHVIEEDSALIKVMNYIDLNPVRAHIVKHPDKYRYSSFRHYAYGKTDPLITDSPIFLEFGNTDQKRNEAYLQMVEEILKDEKLLFKKQNYSCPICNRVCFSSGDLVS